jgi:DNA-binding transcriptional regulator GbsR (MarR family)
MTDNAKAAATEVSSQPDEREMERREFAEQFGVAWAQTGGPRMEGRVIGYLMVMREPYISLSDLAAVLNASAGSVSTTTRRLLDTGFIRRHVIPGDRNYYFCAHDDMWGTWLAGERRHLAAQAQMFERELELIDDDDAEVAAARRRLINGRDYMQWLMGYHKKMLADWEAYKDNRDRGGTP